MNGGAIALAVCAVLAVLSVVLDLRSRRKLRSDYDRLVGRDLSGLVELLPEDLRDKEYTSFVIAPPSTEKLTVGLVYRGEELSPVPGNPPNVGLDFDLKTGELLRVHEKGVPLALK